MGNKLTNRQQEIKEQFIQKRGYWSEEIWESVLELDPDFLEGYLEFSSAPFKKNYISLKDKELIYIAFDVAATHLYEPGTKVHMQNALKLGATKGEIMEVIEIASLLGIHAANIGAPILLEELKRAGHSLETELNERQQQLKDKFIEENGYWDETWEAPLLFDPDFFEAYLGLSSVPSKHGHLDPKMRAFIYLTVDAAATHMYREGVRIHIRNAIKLGVAKEEIMEVLELASTLGIHAATVSVPILASLKE